MALKRRINYHWRLFLPIAAMLCIVFGLIIFYQYKREADYRAKIFVAELDLIDNHILEAYQDDVNLRSFMSFIQQFFKDSMFEGVRISVFRNGRLYYSLGVPLPFNVDDLEVKDKNFEHLEGGESVKIVSDDDDDKFYFLSTARSSDGKIVVRTAMPYNEEVHDQIDIDSSVWLVIILCLTITLVVVYFSTRAFSHNIVLLRDFAYRASTGGHFTGLDDFPKDELGDISREIVKLYRERSKAVDRANRERKVAVHAIEEKARITRQMTNNINHEIKTPVGIIRGYLESILSDPGMDDATRTHFLERMLLNVERLTNLLNDVSTLTRLENGADMIATDRVDLHEMIYQIDNDLPASGLAGSLSFDFDIPLNCEVEGNYNLIHGMICGFIKNAALHSGGTEISFNLISENERFYVFSFADNGTGVAEEHLPHLFERFYRVDTGRSRKVGGTGLGLPIVMSTIESLGGTISVRNRSQGGLEFTFSLPKWHPKHR